MNWTVFFSKFSLKWRKLRREKENAGAEIRTEDEQI